MTDEEWSAFEQEGCDRARVKIWVAASQRVLRDATERVERAIRSLEYERDRMQRAGEFAEEMIRLAGEVLE